MLGYFQSSATRTRLRPQRINHRDRNLSGQWGPRDGRARPRLTRLVDAGAVDAFDFYGEKEKKAVVFGETLRSIQIFDQLAISLINHVALHFQSGREFAAVDREFVGQQRYTAHTLVILQVRGNSGHILLRQFDGRFLLADLFMRVPDLFSRGAQRALQRFPMRNN